VTETVVEQLWRGRVLELRLNRPDQLNALSNGVIDALGRGIRIATESASVAGVFVTANGRAFSAGADLIEARERLASPATFREGLNSWRRVFRGLELCPKPVIAIIDGLAIAGGLELALSCDVIVASDRAKFGDGHITYGLVPGGGGTRRLPDAVGTRAARWLARPVDERLRRGVEHPQRARACVHEGDDRIRPGHRRAPRARGRGCRARGHRAGCPGGPRGIRGEAGASVPVRHIAAEELNCRGCRATDSRAHRQV
jgi:hypothetical protein